MPRSMVMSTPTGAPKKSKFFSIASILPESAIAFGCYKAVSGSLASVRTMELHKSIPSFLISPFNAH